MPSRKTSQRKISEFHTAKTRWEGHYPHDIKFREKVSNRRNKQNFINKRHTLHQVCNFLFCDVIVIMLSHWLEGDNSWYYESSFNIIKITMLAKFQELLNASLAMYLLSSIKILCHLFQRYMSSFTRGTRLNVLYLINIYLANFCLWNTLWKVYFTVLMCQYIHIKGCSYKINISWYLPYV